jgi:CRP-like cAMP-binding protein
MTVPEVRIRSKQIHPQLVPPRDPSPDNGSPEVLAFDLPAEFREIGSTCDYPAGVPLFQQGRLAQDAYLVVSGFVKLVCLDECGKEVIVGLRGAGWLLAATSVILRNLHATTGNTITPCLLQRIPAGQLVTLLSTDLKFSCYVHKLHAREVHFYTEKLAALTSRSATRRLKRLLWHVACGASGTHTVSGPMQIPLKQWEIAQVLAITPEHINRLLKVLEEEGVIRRRKSVLVLVQPEKLLVADRF